MEKPLLQLIEQRYILGSERYGRKLLWRIDLQAPVHDLVEMQDVFAVRIAPDPHKCPDTSVEIYSWDGDLLWNMATNPQPTGVSRSGGLLRISDYDDIAYLFDPLSGRELARAGRGGSQEQVIPIDGLAPQTLRHLAIEALINHGNDVEKAEAMANDAVHRLSMGQAELHFVKDAEAVVLVDSDETD